jgi:hypothetical protein
MQLWPEGFERNHRPNRHQRIVPFDEAFIASVQIEEAKLSHANLPPSEHENLESDLRGGGKRLFFEVPYALPVILRWFTTNIGVRHASFVKQPFSR